MKFNEKEIINLYLEGKTQKEIAIMYNTYNTSIRRILLRNDINVRDCYTAQKRNVTFNFLKDEHYWLGMLAADGCLTNNKIVLQLQKQDKYLLEMFVEASKSKTLKVNSYYNKNYDMQEYYVKFANRDVYSYLYFLGITPRKSNTLCYKGEINWEFFRGYFDGNGCVIQRKSNRCLLSINITAGSLSIINQLHIFLKNYQIKSIVTTIKSNVENRKDKFSLTLHTQNDIYNLYKYMYMSENNLFLKRKKLKFGPLVEKFTSKHNANSGKATSANPEPAEHLEL